MKRVENRGHSVDPSWGPRWETSRGMTVLLEESHVLPLIDVELVVRAGALHDPIGKEGLARLAVRMIRMGTRKVRGEEVDETIDAMGASLSADVGHSAVRFHASVIKRSLPDLLALLGSLITAPALRSEDLGLVQREAIADLEAQRDSDRFLASRAFRGHLFGSHPYGRPTFGSADSLAEVRRADVKGFLEQALVGGSLILGVAGDVTRAELEPMVDRAFGKLGEGTMAEAPLPVPTLKKGRRVLVVDKPERTQTQIYVGTLGTRIGDPLFHPLLVANTAFGGTFTSRLVREVRSERGWSYSASSRLGVDRQREAWTIYTHPAMENAVDCIELELKLLEELLEKGCGGAELANARDFLVKSHAFDRDTAAKRLEPRLDSELNGMPPDFYRRFVDHVSAVTLPRADDALRARLSHEDLSIVVVATAPALLPRLAKLPGVADIAVVPFERV